MKLEDLLKLVGDEHKEGVETFFTAQADKITSLAKELEEHESSNDKTELQGKLDDAIKKRDAAKSQLGIVRDVLGLPTDKEVTRDLVAEYIKDRSKGDAEKDRKIAAAVKDVEELEALVESLKNEKAEAESRLDQVAEETKFIRAFSKSMPDFKAASTVARKNVEDLLRVNAVLEDDEIYYKQGDAYIRVEGEKMTMKTRLGQLQDDPEYSFFFQTKASGGSGSSNSSGGGSGSKFDQRKRASGLK